MQRKKFYIGVDCEGVSCVVGRPGGSLSDSENFAWAQKQATAEANAAATALFDMGAEEVIVWDNHHSGVNLHYDELDSRCSILLGSGHRGRFPTIDESFGGVLFIGYHSRDNVREAALAHTYSSLSYQYYKINGKEVGEMEIDAAFAGLVNVPVIFASSDDKCIAQAKESFPWVETVVTKQSLSWNSVISKHPKTVCREIYDGVKQAAARLEEMQSYTFAEPLNVEIRYKRLDAADSAKLFDRNGERFGFRDAYTRVGTVRTIRNLF